MLIDMVARRPASIYRNFERPFTRTSKKVQKINYIKGIPGNRIARYNIGNTKIDAEVEFSLVTIEDIQIRDLALEAMRVSAGAYIRKNVDDKQFHLKLNVIPHQILREHAQAAVAQADRFYDGMRKPFGKPTGRAARVKAGQPVVTVRTLKGKDTIIKEAFRRAGDKVGCGTKIIKKDIVKK
ncbi:MAG: 50S ribosomal protein L16 [Candidatus Aenigmarchaeota archaeon]|nr:50S ribosomal protein L16 [Candidatus Aenigmarchaeota archaeon]MCK5322400.1 50S ribosomal protein L16 [Candidatus Aenigmarchaeota archaeon]